MAAVSEVAKANAKAYMRDWRKANRPRLYAYNRQWLAAHGRPPRNKSAETQYRVSNLATYAAHQAQRRARQLRATPSWADKDAIQRFYEQRPPGAHVDHTVPLRGRNVCGLHVLENLQYLPRLENLRKSRSYVNG